MTVITHMYDVLLCQEVDTFNVTKSNRRVSDVTLKSVISDVTRKVSGVTLLSDISGVTRNVSDISLNFYISAVTNKQS